MLATARMRVDLPEEDQLRAHLYATLARLLAAPPDRDLLDQIGALEGDATDLGCGVDALAAVAARFTPEQAAREFHDLFIGVGRSELVPYGSYYMAGFLNEKPLARLREDMARLGIARAPAANDPEDGIASLYAIMAGLIRGDFVAPAELETQRAFFAAHIEPWADVFFADLEAAKAAVLYAPVGTIGRTFVSVETTAFGMAA